MDYLNVVHKKTGLKDERMKFEHYNIQDLRIIIYNN